MPCIDGKFVLLNREAVQGQHSDLAQKKQELKTV